MSEKNRPKPVVLIILDGWGIAPPSQGNAVTLAHTPCFDSLAKKYTCLTIQASGENVGLPWGVMGNSEVGHTNIGAGKVIFQSLPRINHAINDGSFFKNKVILDAIAHTQKYSSQLHLMGIISRGDVHGSLDHLFALLDLIKQQDKNKQVFIHGFLDGRDMSKDSGIDFVKEIIHRTKKIKLGQIATLSGRFYAMDRDNHWERIVKVYQTMVKGEATSSFDNPIKAVQKSYQQKIFDEEFLPVVITKHNQPVGKVSDNDAIIFFNYRADRARELTKAFVSPDFDKFNRQQLTNLYFATMTQYEADLPVKIIFSKEGIVQPLGKIISDVGLRQLHIAETQKYAHVTYFFNGGQEKPFPREDDVLIPSPRVASFAKAPKMSAPLVSQR
ncbi:MAG: 2,3-bisphosphoglycerate-independent phosphoglycerate mutase, partial [Candidatus Aenigmarchaeota archaeon]|nr:2,3-bisphosphoglycerate-independent phosphoglycerate mutase [Candidatus Aenigmarchaeota archaeon]